MAPPSAPVSVNRLTLLGSKPGPSMDLPWESFPQKMQSTLDALDANDDGELTVSIEAGTSAEVVFGQQAFDRLYRLFWGYGGIAPNNDRYRDRATFPDRQQSLEKIQDILYQKAVLPRLGSKPTSEDYTWAGRLLVLSADFPHLHALGIQAWGDYLKTSDLRIGRLSENLFVAALRLASSNPDGPNWVPKIQEDLAKIRPTLDAEEKKEFKTQTARPYLIAGSQSPLTAEYQDLVAGENFLIALAVPEKWLKAATKGGKKPEEAIREFFKTEQAVTIRAAADPLAPGKSYALKIDSVEADLPGPDDDPIDSASAYHLDQERLSRTLFKGNKMKYFRVGFKVPQVTDALEGRSTMPFDLILTEKAAERVVPRSVVLQDFSGKASRTLLMSDTHVMEREWEIPAVMAASLQIAAQDGQAGATDLAEDVLRFYQPNNEQVLGLLESANAEFSRGEIDRILVSGDLVDSVNDPISTEFLDYRQTNARTASWILGQSRAPLYVVTGNHDHVGPTKPKSINAANFVFRNELRKLFKDHYDQYRYSGSLVWAGIKRIATRPCKDGDDGCFVFHTLQEMNSDGLHGTPADAFLAHQLRESPYETYSFSIGHGHRLFGWPTEDEHLNYAYYLMEEAEDPVRKDILNRGVQYLKDISPHGKGPQAKNFVAWIMEIKRSQKEGTRLTPFGHYPAFAFDYKEKFEEIDTMTPRAAWAVRQVCYYFRFADGQPVTPIFLAGHNHIYEATVFDLDFMVLSKLLHATRHQHLDMSEAEQQKHFEEEAERLKEKYLAELKKILENPDPKNIYEKLDDLRRDWHLDDIMVTRRVAPAGKDGFPDPLVREFNADPAAFGKKYGTLFLTVPASGPPSDDHTGSVLLTAHPGGGLEIQPRFHRIAHDRSFVQVLGTKLESFRRNWWKEVKAWDPSLKIAAFPAHKDPTLVYDIPAKGYRQKPIWEFLPLVYQYAKGKIGMNVNLESSYGFQNGEWGPGFGVGGELRFPLTDKPHLNFGGPNYLSIGGRYEITNGEAGGFVGLDWGLLRTDLTADYVPDDGVYYGARTMLKSVLPGEPGVGLSFGVDKEGDWRATANLNFSLTLFTRRRKDRFDK